MKLVIVESPAKSNTIQKFLGSKYKIASSYGHVRDLPKTRLGVDTENNFEPKYQITPKARNAIKELRKLAKKSDEILLATDPDREGEAISWHLAHALQLDKPRSKPYKRIVFHEITKSAIQESLNNSRDIDDNLVGAQQARRLLDRIVGYKLSPLLWKKIAKRLSAGRVQSVALRLIVEREREISSFKKEEYWSIAAKLEKKNRENFLAVLSKIENKPISKEAIKTKDDAEKIASELKNEGYFVSNIKKREIRKNPYPPFITSSLQQEAYKRFRFSSKMTMRIAQQLYEKGLITYHRTDSFNLSKESIAKAKDYIIANHGEKFFAEKEYKARQRSQEAHEAIRTISLDENSGLDKRQEKLYLLIKQRFVASQMAPAVFNSATVEVKTSKNKNYTLKSSGQMLKFEGFLKEYLAKYKESELPSLEKNETLSLLEIIPEQHFTQPPPRYTEATLIKTLEENGIGRPSTYAPTISTIQDRHYIEKNEEKRFEPTVIGIAVNDLLTEHFPNIVDVSFTAKMEDDLDLIAEGKKKWQTVVGDFYYPFEKTLIEKEETIEKKEPIQKETGEKCEKCGGDMVYKISRFGEFIACSNYPKCKNIKKDEKDTGIICPDCKEGKVVAKKSKRGRTFYGCNRYPECKFVSGKLPEKNELSNSEETSDA